MSETSMFCLQDLINFLRLHGHNEKTLKIFIFTIPRISPVFESNKLGEETFFELLEILKSYFSSHNCFLRILALRVLISIREFASFKIENYLFPFEFLLEAEQTPLNFQNYRQRATILRRLKCDFLTSKNLSTNIKKNILCVILAQYYERFTLFWPLLSEFVESYAIGLSQKDFWDVFFGFIKNATCFLYEHHSEACSDNKVDYFSFRIQMFKLMAKFPFICEQNSTTLVPLFIKIFRNEFMFDSEQVSYTVLRNTFDELESEKTFNEVIQEVVDNVEVKSRGSYNRKVLIDTLIPLLYVFSRFSNPKALFRHQEVIDIYYELLATNSPELQSCALKCLYTYKFDFLNSYSKHIENMLSANKLSDALVLFCVDEQNSILAENHRQMFLNILIRLLFGLLRVHVASRRSSRRLAIYRFLAGCTSDELDLFFKLVFHSLFTNDVFIPSNGLSQNLLEKVQFNFSFHAIRSVCNHISDIMDYLPLTLSDSHVSYLLSVLITMGISIHQQEYSSKKEQTPSSFYKNHRILVFKNIIKFYDVFRKRNILPELSSVLFSHLIAPEIEAHNDKCSQNNQDYAVQPQILELFCSWANKTKYHVLLNVSLLSGLTPVSLLCDALNDKNIAFKLKCVILNSIENLLSTKKTDYEQLTGSPTILQQEVNITFEISEAKMLSGSAFIVPNIKKLFNFFVKVFAEKDKHLLYSNHTLFSILSRVSEFIPTSEIGQDLIEILLSSITFSWLHRDEEKMVVLLNTLANLSIHTTDVYGFLRKISSLFSRLNGRQLRESLVKAACSLLGHKSLQLTFIDKMLLSLLSDLESWDSRFIHEPDTDRRCAVFQKLETIYCGDEEISLELLQIYAHSNAYCLLTSSNVSLKTVIVSSFQHLVYFVSRKQSDLKKLNGFLNGHIVPLILRGIRLSGHQNELTRQFAFLECLSKTVSSFNNDPTLCQLLPLNHEDEEQNFFCNMAHIQTHRRQRALFRLTEQLKSGEIDIKYNVLLKFIVPLIQPYLMETTPKLSAISDQALSLLTVILSKTPWTKYYQTFDLFMRKIVKSENMKGSIRAITALLDAYHFDLSDVEEPVSYKEQRSKKNFGRQIDISMKNEDCQESMAIDDDMTSLKIYRVTMSKIIPRLKDCINPRNIRRVHKKAGHSDFENEEELLVRAPLTLGIAKLLKKLPHWALIQNLDGLVLTLKIILNSRSPAIRKNARILLEQLMFILGPKHLAFVIKELKHTMTKGYQVPVMAFAAFKVTESIQSIMQNGDMNTSLQDLIDICQISVFGDELQTNEFQSSLVSSEERRKMPEEKVNKIIDVFTLIGRFIDSEKFLFVVDSLKGIIDSRPRLSTSKHLSEWLKGFCVGLRLNTGISTQSVFVHVKAILVQHIPEMLKDQDRQLRKSNVNTEHEGNSKFSLRPASCLLIAPEPKRLESIVKVTMKSKVSIFVEFALQLLADVFKSKNMVMTDGTRSDVMDDEKIELLVLHSSIDETLLNSFVPLIMDTIKLKYDKIIGLSLRCLFYLSKCSGKVLKMRIDEIADRLFVIFHDYVGLGSVANKQEIVELQQLLYKCFTYLIREATIGPERIEILLNYAEADILDTHKHSSAFILVKTLIKRKVEHSKMENFIKYLAEQAIISSSQSVRSQCRQTILLYISHHSRGQKNYKQWVEFFMDQFEYEFEDGRMSAYEMIFAVLDAFVEEVNDEFAFMAFIRLASRLTNDDSERCSLYVGLCIKKLLNSITESAFNDIYIATKDWLDSEKVSIRLLALNSLVHLIDSETPLLSNFRAKEVLNKVLMISCITDRVLLQSDQPPSEQILIFTLKFLSFFAKTRPELIRSYLMEISLDNFFANLSDLAQGKFSWQLQIGVDDCISEIFFPCPEVCNLLSEINNDIISTLCHSIAGQFGFGETASCMEGSSIPNEMKLKRTEHAVRCLVILLPHLGEIKFHSICRRLRRFGWLEAARGSDAYRRISLFKLVAALSINNLTDTALSTDIFAIMCKLLFPLIYREMSRKSKKYQDELFNLASEVGQVIRGRMNPNAYSTLLMQCQNQSSEKTIRRKQELKSKLIANPSLAAAEKLKKQKQKQISRKRKIDRLKPHRIAKRRKASEVD